jgi:hypothetical protein
MSNLTSKEISKLYKFNEESSWLMNLSSKAINEKFNGSNNQVILNSYKDFIAQTYVFPTETDTPEEKERKLKEELYNA